jgi:hypothetical protein
MKLNAADLLRVFFSFRSTCYIALRGHRLTGLLRWEYSSRSRPDLLRDDDPARSTSFTGNCLKLNLTISVLVLKMLGIQLN